MTTESNIAERLARLHTALLADVLDGLGFRDSAFGPGIAPFDTGVKVVGRAFTIRWETVDVKRDEPYDELLAAYPHMKPGDVIVMQAAEQRSAMWGELLSTAAAVKGVTGAVMDGTARDIEQMLDMDFPVFATGVSPLDSAGRQEAVSSGEVIRCGDATVHPGDWVFGDRHGVIVIPMDLVDEAVTLAEAKDAGESTVRDELLAGAEIGEVFKRYGIL